MKPPLAAFTSAMSACGKARFNPAVNFIVNHIFLHEYFRPNVDWRAAIRVMDHLRNAEHRPNTITCNALMSTLAKAKQWYVENGSLRSSDDKCIRRRAQRLFDWMITGDEEDHMNDDSSASGLRKNRLHTRPNEVTYTTLINAYAGSKFFVQNERNLETC